MTQDVQASPEGRPLVGGRLVALVAMLAPVTAAQIPLALYLPALYANVYGIPLATVGAVFLLGRAWDAISDPLIGSLSDATRTRFGRRRPWIAVGGLLFALATVALFFPMSPPTPLSMGVALFFFYLGWTMIQIPLYAWMGEISRAYHERTRIVTYGQTVQAASLLFILSLPAIMDCFRPEDSGLKLAAMGGFILVALVPALLLTLLVNREPHVTAPRVRVPVREALGATFGNPLLARVLASDFAVTLGQGIRASLFLFFVSAYVGQPALAAALFLLQAALGVAAAPIWLRIGYRMGKHRAVVAGELVQVAINLGLLLVMPGSIALPVALTAAQGLAQGSGNQMLRAIVADVADACRLESGQDRAGLMFSVFSLSGKIGTAAAIGIALPLVAWIGFTPRGVNGPEALLGLKLVFALGPALAHMISAMLVAGFPLDERRHAEIRAALARGHALSQEG